MILFTPYMVLRIVSYCVQPPPSTGNHKKSAKKILFGKLLKSKHSSNEKTDDTTDGAHNVVGAAHTSGTLLYLHLHWSFIFGIFLSNIIETCLPFFHETFFPSNDFIGNTIFMLQNTKVIATSAKE